MTPTPSHGQQSVANSSPAVRIFEIFPPRTIEMEDAVWIVGFLYPADPHVSLIGQLMREPRQQDSFVLVASLKGTAVGYLKLQHGRKGDARRAGICWIRELAVDVDRRRNGIGRALIRHAWSLVHPHEQLAVEVAEHATDLQLFFAAAGLECRPPWGRTKRQADRQVYEFQSVQPTAAPYLGRPRFTWPAPVL